MTSPIRLLVVHGHPLFLEGLLHTLDQWSDIHVVAGCSSIEEASRRLARMEADIALVSLDLPDGTALDFCRRAPVSHPGLRVALLATSGDVDTVVEAMQSGAAALVFSDMSTGELTDALRRLRSQWSVFDAAIDRLVGSLSARPDVVPRLNGSAPAPGSPSLSDRESEILRLVRDGLSNKEIASLLNISISTVANHLKSAFRKLGVGGRTQAVVAALHHGLL